LMWAVGIVLLIGLPQYYRQAPGYIPSFYTSLFKRKIILVRLSPTQIDVDTNNYSTVVLRCGHHTELLAFSALRP